MPSLSKNISQVKYFQLLASSISPQDFKLISRIYSKYGSQAAQDVVNDLLVAKGLDENLSKKIKSILLESKRTAKRLNSFLQQTGFKLPKNHFIKSSEKVSTTNPGLNQALRIQLEFFIILEYWNKISTVLTPEQLLVFRQKLGNVANNQQFKKLNLPIVGSLGLSYQEFMQQVIEKAESKLIKILSSTIKQVDDWRKQGDSTQIFRQLSSLDIRGLMSWPF